MQNIFDSVVLIVVDSLPFMNRWSTYFANTPEIEGEGVNINIENPGLFRLYIVLLGSINRTHI